MGGVPNHVFPYLLRAEPRRQGRDLPCFANASQLRLGLLWYRCDPAAHFCGWWDFVSDGGLLTGGTSCVRTYPLAARTLLTTLTVLLVQPPEGTWGQHCSCLRLQLSRCAPSHISLTLSSLYPFFCPCQTLCIFTCSSLMECYPPHGLFIFYEKLFNSVSNVVSPSVTTASVWNGGSRMAFLDVQYQSFFVFPGFWRQHRGGYPPSVDGSSFHLHKNCAWRQSRPRLAPQGIPQGRKQWPFLQVLIPNGSMYVRYLDVSRCGALGEYFHIWEIRTDAFEFWSEWIIQTHGI